MLSTDYAQVTDHLGKPWIVHVRDLAQIQIANRVEPKRSGYLREKQVRKRKERNLIQAFGVGTHLFGEYVVKISPASKGGFHVQVGINDETDPNKPARYRNSVVDTLYPHTNKRWASQFGKQVAQRG